MRYISDSAKKQIRVILTGVQGMTFHRQFGRYRRLMGDNLYKITLFAIFFFYIQGVVT